MSCGMFYKGSDPPRSRNVSKDNRQKATTRMRPGKKVTWVKIVRVGRGEYIFILSEEMTISW